MATTLLRAGWIVTMDPGLGVLRNGGVLVNEDRIVEVGHEIAPPQGTEVIDAPEAIVIPTTDRKILSVVGPCWIETL